MSTAERRYRQWWFHVRIAIAALCVIGMIALAVWHG